jgi:hypothetical protein
MKTLANVVSDAHWLALVEAYAIVHMLPEVAPVSTGSKGMGSDLETLARGGAKAFVGAIRAFDPNTSRLEPLEKLLEQPLGSLRSR